MKKTILLLLLLSSLSFGNNSNNSTNIICNNVIFINPIGYCIPILFGVFNFTLEYQHLLNDSLSFSIMPEIGLNYNLNSFGIACSAGVSYFPIGNGFNGLYISIYPAVGWITSPNLIYGEGDIAFGWNFAIEKNMLLSFGIECGYNTYLGPTVRILLAEIGFEFN